MQALRESLSAWAETARRDLPWRRTRDPWAVLVSELMLQQTQVPRVVPRYEAFLERFPTPAATAAAPVADVVRAWAGLGYNRRAVNLHRAAVAVVERHGGQMPATLDQLVALPGVGPYTARAVLAFAFEADVG
ncbi:MAG TPA: A/G-specific adenine glycosylase, partial [Acidimicrobiales bacterium]|nr:A/G-specific adenine glycosylase [Acidimicrobiales bacterium]